MLMNFSAVSEPIPLVYLSQDETDILVLAEKLDKDYELYGGNSDATISKS